jgi:hypothetical protein
MRREATAAVPLSVADRVRLLWRVWWSAGTVVLMLRRHRLPDLVGRLGRERPIRAYPPLLVSRAVSRGLRIGGWQPRCLIRSLVLYRLLCEQGESPELVIGLAHEPHSHDAHAWIELEGVDVGPSPGRGVHVPLARYPVRP